MTAKRFKLDDFDSEVEMWELLNIQAEVIFDLEKENEQLKQAIAETEKMIQSTYDELTKLRCIKKNLGRIKAQWNWIMECVDYD